MMKNSLKHLTYIDPFENSISLNFGIDSYGKWMEFGHNHISQKFRWIKPGFFLMGSPESEPERNCEEALHEVEVTKGFWMSDTTISQEFWYEVMGERPSFFTGNSLPVEQVSWLEAQDFIKEVGDIMPELELSLPTEAQWEYACRAHSTTPFHLGENIATDMVNYDGSAPYNNTAISQWQMSTCPVKDFQPNAWGLYQMHGNVMEWCQDWLENYPCQTTMDPSGPFSGTRKVIRGGAWIFGARYCRSAFRSGTFPQTKTDFIGFRLVSHIKEHSKLQIASAPI